ncbi:hypothetical protein MKX01_038496 [Papaver californicum]|nr:hypothetical protein MKX01_038496 [Papaver californicum]
MFQREPFHLPRDDYFKRLQNGEVDLKIISDTIDWIGKVHRYYNFGPLSAYLSINYLDRFISAYELPRGKSWMMQLLVVACLSIAGKMEETELTLSLDLQCPKPNPNEGLGVGNIPQSLAPSNWMGAKMRLMKRNQEK